MAEVALILNAGSSSLKFLIAERGDDGAPVTVAAGKIESIGTAPRMVAFNAEGRILEERHWKARDIAHEALLAELIGWIDTCLAAGLGKRLVGVGHRVVHGGTRFAAPLVITDDILGALDVLSPLAPQHQPHNLAAIRMMRAAMPHLPQVACFDTAFHRTQPDVATRIAIPRAFADVGIRRYGFHGISYDYIARRLAAIDPKLAGGRVVAAHLGNGASLCAMLGGRSVETTMGFTALDGLMMGTRCGSIDPGVVLHLIEKHAMTAADVQHLLYDQSGLLGVSGISSDMRDLLAHTAPEAHEAVALFVYRVARETAALANALGGIDGIVFTAGIGENAAAVRAMVCERLDWLGIELDAAANARGDAVITTPSSRVRVRVIPTREEHMIALHTFALVGISTAPAA